MISKKSKILIFSKYVIKNGSPTFQDFTDLPDLLDLENDSIIICKYFYNWADGNLISHIYIISSRSFGPCLHCKYTRPTRAKDSIVVNTGFYVNINNPTLKIKDILGTISGWIILPEKVLSEWQDLGYAEIIKESLEKLEYYSSWE